MAIELYNVGKDLKGWQNIDIETVIVSIQWYFGRDPLAAHPVDVTCFWLALNLGILHKLRLMAKM